MISQFHITRKQIAFYVILVFIGSPLIITLISTYHTEDIVRKTQTQLIDIKAMTKDTAFSSLGMTDSKQVSKTHVNLDIIRNNLNDIKANLEAILKTDNLQYTKFEETFTIIQGQYDIYKTSIDLIENQDTREKANNFSNLYVSVNNFVNSQNNLFGYLETTANEIQNSIYLIQIILVVLIVSACFYVTVTAAKWRSKIDIARLEGEKLKLQNTRTLIESKYEELYLESERLIRRQLEERRQVEDQKDEFMSMITHELKTPLFPIEAHCELLSDTAFGNKLSDDQTESINEIYKNSKNLERLIGDVLEAQKIEMQRLTFKKDYFPASSFISDFVKGFKTVMDERGIEFISSNETNPMIFSDKERLNQVLGNLITNAIDFVPKQKGKIELVVKEKDAAVIFYVKDNGIGIPKDKQENLFKKFYQIDTSIKRKHSGNGLGLVICKGIVEAMGGKIWVESEFGKGATFYFSVQKAEKRIELNKS